MKARLWSVLLAAAVLWPARVVGPLDGAPLDTMADAVVIGLLLPALWWLGRRGVTTRLTQAAIVLLLAWKAFGAAAITQQGLCVAMSAGRPLSGFNSLVPIEEPTGALRSWDVRADWRDPSPRCTAIVTRPLTDKQSFPAWFLNLTVQLPGPKDVVMRATGFATTGSATEPVDIHAVLTGDSWSFDPAVDGRPVFGSGLVTIAPPTEADRLIGRFGWMITWVLVMTIVVSLAVHVANAMALTAATIAGVGVVSTVAMVVGLAADSGVQRLGALVLFAGAIIPVSARLRNSFGAFLLIGVPWLAFIAALSAQQVGRFTLYSDGDDWLTYQVASHRIYFQGYWLEGGNAVFDFQPFYRWMTGALHLVFGDSSVGELYWDASCLLMGALLAFHLARAFSGFRVGLLAAGAVLATMTIGTPWYFLGRGLSEIAAAGWAFLAMFFLLRGRRGSAGWALAAGVAAVLMFYTRLNHVLFALFFPAFLLPSRTTLAWSRLGVALGGVRWSQVVVFGTTFAAGVAAFAWRTWHYTGVFSLFYGTSLKNNDTGLRPWTLLDVDVWARIATNLQATIFMNEPPRPDPRAIVMVAGVAVAVGALVWTRLASRVPVIAWIASAGGILGAFLAFSHNYPGRFTIHLLPFASALALSGAAVVWQRKRFSAA